MDNFSVYEVGKQVIQPCKDGVRFGFSEDSAILLISFSNPTANEKKAFKDGLSLRFVVKNNIIFILSRMGTLNWMDAPYYRYYNEYRPNLSVLDKIKDGLGISMHVMFVDASTGILIAQKLIGCKTEGSRKLVEAIKSQPIIDNYDIVLNRTMMMYSTSRLVQDSAILF